ncbi:MAG: ATP-binding protein [Desulfopila sp.]|nr:ATP-binding protein [Desulfopila sp.]
MELKFIANLPTLGIYIIDLRLGLLEEAAFFRHELASSLEKYLSGTASAHRFSIVSVDGQELLALVNGKVVPTRLEVESAERLEALQAFSIGNEPELPELQESIKNARLNEESVTDTWPLVDSIHNEVIGGLVYTYEVPRHELLAGPKRILWFNLLYNMAGLLILFTLFYLIIDYHTRPLRRLTLAVRSIMEGDLSKTVVPKGYGETLTLSESFEEMRNRLQRSFGEIQSNNIELAALLEKQRQISEQLTTSQQRFLHLAEHSRTFVWELDSEALFLSVSPVIEDVLGYSPRELIGRRYYYELMNPVNPQPAREEFFEVVKGGKSSLSNEKVLFAADGQEVWLMSRSMPLIDENGNISGYYGSDTDISEKKRAEEENEKLQLQLQHAQKMEAIGTMAGGIAHDFNNLLQVMNGYAQIMLTRKTPDDPEYEGLTRIYSSGERAAGLIRQLLTFSRKLKNDRTLLDLNHEIMETAKMWQQSLPRMIDTNLSLSNNLWLIYADPVQIQQVLLNLVTNAAHAMPDGGKLSVRTDNVILDESYCHENSEVAPGRYILLVVADTGCGMDSKTIDRIFDPFFTTKEVGQGTGLGLASAYGIIKSHGGHIRCASQLGLGTEFSIYLPVTDEQVGEVRKKSSSVASIEGKETLLIVDDEEMIRELVGDYFSSFGYTIIPAATGEEALEVCRRKPDYIDLMLLDMNMPGMGGHKCLSEVHTLWPDMKVLIASGYSPHGPVQDTLALGAKGFIGKPYRLEELAVRIRQILQEDS